MDEERWQGKSKGEVLEDLVEHYFELRGFKGLRGTRVRGLSGAIHEIDLLLSTSEGPVVVEVKNTAAPVPKEVVMKAFEVARDIGAHGAVVISASGFTRDALRVAQSLGVETLTLDDILEFIESSRAAGGSVFLEFRVPWERLDSEARRRAEKMLWLIPRERPERLGCLYAPMYIVDAMMRVSPQGPRYRDVVMVFSAVSGFPLYRRGDKLLEGAQRSTRLPPELAELYRALAGRVFSRSEAYSLAGERSWRSAERILEGLGLLEVLRLRPRLYRLLDDRPPLDAIEDAADLLIAPKAGGPGGCRVVEPRYSPGAAAAAAERLYGASPRRVTTLSVPIAAYRLVGRGSYRFLLLTAWTRKPLALEVESPEDYLVPLLETGGPRLSEY